MVFVAALCREAPHIRPCSPRGHADSCAFPGRGCLARSASAFRELDEGVSWFASIPATRLDRQGFSADSPSPQVISSSAFWHLPLVSPRYLPLHLRYAQLLVGGAAVFSQRLARDRLASSAFRELAPPDSARRVLLLLQRPQTYSTQVDLSVTPSRLRAPSPSSSRFTCAHREGCALRLS